MRILFLADSLGNGGLERQLALFATNLPAGWQPRVWAMGGGPFLGWLQQRGVPVTVCERRFRLDPSPGTDLWLQLRRWRPDVVHSWSWMSTLLAGPLCRLLEIPLVDGSIQTGAQETDMLWLRRLGKRFPTTVAANSHAGLQAWGIGPAKGRVIYTGFDHSRLPNPSKHADRDSGHLTVVMTGRMVPVKHYDIVIQAARSLSGGAAEWRFRLVGDGSDRQRLIASASDLIESGIVEFPEPRIEVIDLVQSADVGVLMTDPALAHEGCSNSILEYMACGLPVVCGEGGGNRELVQDGVTGFVIPPGDPEALAARLLCLRDDPQLRSTMGRAGREVLESRFSLPSIIAEARMVYEDATRVRSRLRQKQASP